MSWGLRSVYFILISVALSGCSLDMFRSGRDRSVPEKIGYRQINSNCTGLNLSSSNIDVPLFRGLLDCFNANGALDPIAKLTRRLKDSELEPLVHVLNAEILNRPEILFQLEKTHQQLKTLGLLDETMTELGDLIANDDLIISGIALLKSAYFTENKKSDPKILKTLKLLSPELNSDHIIHFVRGTLTTLSSTSAQSLASRFSSPSPAEHTLDKLAQHLVRYLNPENGEATDLGNKFLQVLATEALFRTIDPVTGVTTDELKSKVPEISAALHAFFSSETQAAGLGRLFHSAHQKLSCLNESVSIPDAALFMFGEMARRASLNPDDVPRFIQKDNLVTLSALAPFCSMPPELGQYYPALASLANTSAIYPISKIIQATYREREVTEFFIALLADKNFEQIVPLLQELDAREVWSDLILTLNVLPLENRAGIAETARFILAPQQELNQESVNDVFTQAFRKTKAPELERFIRSFGRYAGPDHSLLGLTNPLHGIRTYLLANSARPWIEILQSSLAHAPQNEKFFETLFSISEQPEFKESIQLLATMAKDGRARDLLDTIFTLFHKFSEENGQTVLTRTAIPPFVPKFRHNLASKDLEPFNLYPLNLGISDACAKLDPTLDLSKLSSPSIVDQIDRLASCTHTQALRMLLDGKTERGDSLLAWMTHQVQGIDLNPAETTTLVNGIIGSLERHELDAVYSLIPLWVGSPQDPSSEVLRPLIELTLPLLTNLRTEIHTFFNWLGSAQALASSEFPKILTYVHSLVDNATGEADPKKDGKYPTQLILDSLQKIECRSIVPPRVRANELISEFENSVTGWENPRRFSWTLPTFKAQLEPELKRFENPIFTDYLLKFLGTLGKRKKIAQFLIEKSTDLSPIPYLYPGDDNPQVKLVNTLDRMELLLINADFIAPIIHNNYGLKYTSEIAEAWGDEPRENWPPEIQAKFKNDTPPTLDEALKSMERSNRVAEFFVGIPSATPCDSTMEASSTSYEPETSDLTAEELSKMTEPASFGAVRRALFNMHYLLPVLRENLPDPKRPEQMGMQVLRDLFFALLYSTPPQFRDSDQGSKHQISFILKLIRLGVTRQLGRQVAKMTWQMDSPQITAAGLSDAVGAIADLSTAPKIKDTAKLVFQQPDHALIWEIMSSIFDAYQAKASPPRNSAPLQGLLFDALALAHQQKWVAPSALQMNGILTDQLAPLTRHFKEITSFFNLDPGPIAQEVAQFYRDTTPGKTATAHLLSSTLENLELGRALARILILGLENDAIRSKSTLFFDRTRMLLHSPAYREIPKETLFHTLLTFFEESSTTPEWNSAARKIRLSLAHEMTQGEIEQLLTLIAYDPARFHQILEALRDASKSGELQGFIEFLSRALSTR